MFPETQLEIESTTTRAVTTLPACGRKRKLAKQISGKAGGETQFVYSSINLHFSSFYLCIFYISLVDILLQRIEFQKWLGALYEVWCFHSQESLLFVGIRKYVSNFILMQPHVSDAVPRPLFC